MTQPKAIAILDPRHAEEAATVLDFIIRHWITLQEGARLAQIRPTSMPPKTTVAVVAAELRAAAAYALRSFDSPDPDTPHPITQARIADFTHRIRHDLEEIDWTTVDSLENVVEATRAKYLATPSPLTTEQRKQLQTFIQELTLALFVDAGVSSNDPHNTQ